MIVIVLLVGFVLINEQMSQDNKDSFIPIEDSNAYAYQIESMIDENEMVALKGWFFELKNVRGKEIEFEENEKLGIILYELSSEKLDNSSEKRKGVSLEVEHQKRTDIDNYFKCDYDYSDCGFVARINKKMIDLQNGDYQIIFKTNESGMNGISSGIFIHNGELSYVNPMDKMDFKSAPDDVREIVEKGVCVASCPESHMCVYQCGWKLYWIADEQYEFCENGKTYIQFQIDTTQFDNLPIERIENGAQTDNIGDLFENHEITSNGSYGKYRVAVRDIPSEYSVVRIITGFYKEDNWVWRRFIRPIYSFR